MADKAQALHSFWSSFGIPAYDENTVPDNAPDKYITYEIATASFGDGDIALAANIWDIGDPSKNTDTSKSWAYVTKKSDEISLYLGEGGKTIKTDTGYIWIKRRSPFAQRMKDTNENSRRILLGISAEFIDY